MTSLPQVPNKIAVHARRVVLAGGTLEHESVVECPRRAAATPLHTCTACTEYTGMSLDRSRERSYVVCGLADAPISVLTTGATQVEEIMATGVLCVRDDVPLEELRLALVREDTRSAPVVDSRRRPIGMISGSDLLPARPPGAVTGEAMTAMAFSVAARATISQAAAIMSFEGVHQLPVIAEDGTVIGLITALDVLRWEARQNGTLRSQYY